MRNVKVVFVSVVIVILVTGVAVAASQYGVGRSVVSSGGGDRASASYVAHDVIGEAAGGTSQSQSYELRAGFPIMPVSTLGDANMDGTIDGRDVVRCKKIILGLEEETCGANANGDEVIDGRDVIRIKKMVLGIEP